MVPDCDRIDGTGARRTLRALSGAGMHPPVRGFSFLPPEAASAVASALDPDAVLSTAMLSARADFAFVPSWEPWAGRLVSRLRAGGVAALWVVPGVLWPVLEEIGVEAGLRDTVRDPGSMTDALDRAAGAMLAAVALGVGLRADGIVVADDLAGSAGPLVAPDFATDQIIPRLAGAAAAAERAGLPAILHSDGETAAFLRGLRAGGFVGLHAGGLSYDAFERILGRARREGLVVLGGVGARDLESLPEAVLAGTRLGILAEAGGLLISDDGCVTTRSQYAALLTALAAAGGDL